MHDKALLKIKNEKDEIVKYVDGRYLSASEACWKIFGYSMHREFQALQDWQSIYQMNKSCVLMKTKT